MGGEQIGPMHGGSRANTRVIRVKLSAKINPLFLIRLAGGELASHREISTPGFTAARHRNLLLGRKRLIEERVTRAFQIRDQGGAHPMSDDVKEPVIATRAADLVCDRSTVTR